MLTQYEARRLQRDMKHELDATPAAVLKCAAGLLIVVAMAVAGSLTDLGYAVGGAVAGVTAPEQSSGVAVARVQNGDVR